MRINIDPALLIGCIALTGTIAGWVVSVEVRLSTLASSQSAIAKDVAETRIEVNENEAELRTLTR